MLESTLLHQRILRLRDHNLISIHTWFVLYYQSLFYMSSVSNKAEVSALSLILLHLAHKAMFFIFISWVKEFVKPKSLNLNTY